MVVAGVEEVVWEEGKIVVFDDSFEHEIWNLSSQPRLILVVDLLHPDMTQGYTKPNQSKLNLTNQKLINLDPRKVETGKTTLRFLNTTISSLN